MSGMTVFPKGSNLGIMVTAHGSQNFWFYEFDGSSLTYLGSAACPLTVSQSRGLTYSAQRGTFFWSYSVGGTDHIAELGIDFVYTNTQPTSLGNIKAMFN
jgi:hypothetical protein